MENRLNEFDQLIKNTYENHEFPYDPMAWEDLEVELNIATPGISDYFKSITTGLAVTGVIFASMLIYFSGDGVNKNIDEVVENKGVIAKIQQSPDNLISEKDPNEMDPENTSIITAEATSKDEELSKDPAQIEGNRIATDKAETASTGSSSQNEQSSKKPVISEAGNEQESSDNFEIGEGEASVRKGCTGLTIRFDAPEEYGDDAKYLWNFGDGYFSNEANPSHTFNKEGIFDVSLSVTSLSSGQISSNVVQAMIEVVDAPVANFDLVIASMNSFTLKNNSSNSNKSQWEVNGEIQRNSSDIRLSLTDNTKYEIRLLAQAEGSCIDTLEKNIHIVKAGNQFPQVYSSAYASEYAPGAIVDNGTVKDFRVYDKSTGKEIYRSSGQKGWNGKNSSGEAAKQGEYIWVMIVDSDESVDIYRGMVNLR